MCFLKSNAEEELEEAKKERDEYLFMLEIATCIHENLEDEIDKYIVDTLNDIAQKVEGKDPSINLLPYYVMLDEEYDKLSEDQKKNLNFEIDEVRDALDEARILKHYLDKAIMDE